MFDTNERPPYVEFEYRAMPNRAKSEEAGHVVYDDVAFAMITPAGSRDCVEKVAEDWLQYIDKQAQEGRYNPAWARGFRANFKEWQSGNEVPESGTGLRQWPQITPAELKMCLGANVRTVEDLAAANEPTLQRIGMSGRVLKDKAETWLKASAGGKVSEEIAGLRQMVREQQDVIERLTKQLDSLPKKRERAEAA